MHRYRLETAYLQIDAFTGKAKNDTPKGYYLVDERGNRITREPLPMFSYALMNSLNGNDETDEDRFERYYFETPEEAWAALPEGEYYPADKELYRHYFTMKDGSEYEHISEYRGMPGSEWAHITTIEGSNVMIAMSEVKHYQLDKI